MSDLEKLLRVDSAPLPPPFVVPENLDHLSYCLEDSPVGELLLACTRRGLVRIAYLAEGDGDAAPGERPVDAVLQDLADRVTPRVLEQAPALDEVRRELEQFFAGKRHEFDLRIDWRLTGGFTQRVLRATATIPFGELSTYKHVATAAGNERAARAAGNALGANPIPIVVPCHRVLHSGGGLGGYTGGLERKLRLLRVEGHRR